MLEKQHPVICDNATKILRLIRPVVRENEKLADRIARFKELQLKSQLNRKLEICERELALNDPVEQIDIKMLFEKAIEKYPIPDDVQSKSMYFLKFLFSFSILISPNFIFFY